VRRAILAVLAALVLAVPASALAPGPPRALRVLTGGHSVLASLVHVCIKHDRSVDCTARPVHLKGTLRVAPRARLALKLDRAAGSVTVGLMRGTRAIGAMTRASGSGNRFHWTAPRSLDGANRLNVVARYAQSNSRFLAAIR
jgi:hypothetical protein